MKIDDEMRDLYKFHVELKKVFSKTYRYRCSVPAYYREKKWGESADKLGAIMSLVVEGRIADVELLELVG